MRGWKEEEARRHARKGFALKAAWLLLWIAITLLSRLLVSLMVKGIQGSPARDILLLPQVNG